MGDKMAWRRPLIHQEYDTITQGAYFCMHPRPFAVARELLKIAFGNEKHYVLENAILEFQHKQNAQKNTRNLAKEPEGGSK